MGTEARQWGMYGTARSRLRREVLSVQRLQRENEQYVIRPHAV
jgi:hypothetical protein